MVFLKAFVIWLTFIIAESMNGVVRELWLVSLLGDMRAHQVSFVIGSMLVLAIAILLIHWLNVSRTSHLIQIGLLWLVLTLGFEVSLGHFILGYSWNQIAADYNLLQGGLMPFGLALLAFAPLIAAKLRHIWPGKHQSV